MVSRKTWVLVILSRSRHLGSICASLEVSFSGDCASRRLQFFLSLGLEFWNRGLAKSRIYYSVPLVLWLLGVQGWWREEGKEHQSVLGRSCLQSTDIKRGRLCMSSSFMALLLPPPLHHLSLSGRLAEVRCWDISSPPKSRPPILTQMLTSTSGNLACEHKLSIWGRSEKSESLPVSRLMMTTDKLLAGLSFLKMPFLLSKINK